jgi:hypothetical protein
LISQSRGLGDVYKRQGGEPSSPNCGVSAEGRARHLLFFFIR